jgi:V8-like Glu-specific endopeptidase
MRLLSVIFLIFSVVAAQSAPPRKDIPSIAKAAKGAIVSIIMSDKDGHSIAQGTGFVVSKDGRVVTNYHVIENGSSAIVKLPDGAFFIVDGVLASDNTRDVAVIKAHGENFRTLTLGNSDRVQVGEEVVAIGNPLSLESTVSNGIVSGIRTAEELGGKFLQVTTPISPGSSGGPLFNMAGEVVGITTLYLKGGENLNFAIPINDVKHLLSAKFSKVQPFPNEPETVGAQTNGGNAPSSARDYYQQLYVAGGFFRKRLDGHMILDADYACFSDDAHSDIFFAFEAKNYDENYIKAFDKYMDLLPDKGRDDPRWHLSTDQKEEMGKQIHIFREIEREQNASYVKFVLDYNPTLHDAFPNGGRFLQATVYEKGVKVDAVLYLWDGSSWVGGIHNLTATAKVSNKIVRLSIEPATMRYVESTTVPTTTESGETVASDTHQLGRQSGVCEKIRDPN